MGKLTIQEVAKILTEKNGLSPREASNFAAEMFSVILQRLQEGDAVKVKGLGTFKIINVEARESVSVRTGERVVIDSHSKVTFTPLPPFMSHRRMTLPVTMSISFLRISVSSSGSR